MSLYFMAILPPEQTTEKINALKKDFAEQYKCCYAYRKITHITLQKPFQWSEDGLTNLRNSLSTFFKHFRSFSINLSGFGHFGERVIYINIANPKPLKSLRNNLIEHLQYKLYFTDKMIGRKYFTPHVTIANRDLTKSKFYKAWEIYTNKNFTDSFRCKRVWLLKHDGKRWHPHLAFNLDEG